MWGYINKISSLEEKALAQVAINLCQENDFKEVALRLEKPTYGSFISLHEHSFFVSDPQKLCRWPKVEKHCRFNDGFMRSYYLNDTVMKVRQWDTAVDEQCQRLTEEMPNRLRQNIHPWINRIALEYLSYSRRQEVLFGVSRYFLMDIFTRGDWKEAARLDEKKLAERLLQDERLTVLQRYRIACVYCLHVHIPPLWERLTQEEKRFTIGVGKCGLSEETHSLVLLWSLYMEEKVACLKPHLWEAVSQAVSYGNSAALMVCWNGVSENRRQTLVIDWALQSLRQLQCVGGSNVKEKLVSYKSPEEQSDIFMKHFNLPSYYSELIFFLLSQMDEEQQLTFVKKAFQSGYHKSVLDWLLDWPHQDDFLPTINRLWEIIPKEKYGQCLLDLAIKYSGNDKTANRDYDYQSLLRTLWEETPKEYKQYVFRVRKTYCSVINEGEKLLSRLLERSPFQEKDEGLFKLIFLDQPQETRRAMMLSKGGEYMCSLLIQKEKWSFLNGLLEECLSKEEIPEFKKQYIQSDGSVKLCFDALKENRENLVEDLLDWSSKSDVEKTQVKEKLIENTFFLHSCDSLLYQRKFAHMERVINFCLSSDEKKEQLKVHLAERACVSLLHYYTSDAWSEDFGWEKMDTIIAWSVDTEEKIRDFKKNLFFRKGIDIHYQLVLPETLPPVLPETLPGMIKRFYQWFGLSPKEIKQLKRDILFRPDCIKYIHENLPEYSTLADTLCLCLADEEMVIDLKKEIEEYCTDVLDERWEMKEELLDHLVSELLDGFRKEEVQDLTSRGGVFVKDTGGKRSCLAIEDESSSPRKRQK